MRTVKLFNAVISKPSQNDIFISSEGFIITPNALWAKDKIEEYFLREKLNGKDLNKGFHKSWQKIKESSRLELYLEQIQHYLSTYGSNFTEEAYIPQEKLDIPTNLKFKVIRGLEKEDLQQKALDLLENGVALKEETVDDLLKVLVDDLDYTFNSVDNIKNKEAQAKISDWYGIYPKDPQEFLRYVIFKSTGQTLLIKNEELIEKIKNSGYNPTILFKNYGLEKLATIFNRFKPLFLAYKGVSGKTINKISKLSKSLHKPLVQNPLQQVTQRLLIAEDKKWLENATIFSLFKALQSCNTRLEGQNTFMYKIRDGKTFSKENQVTNKKLLFRNFLYLQDFLYNKFNLRGKTFLVPENVFYGLPTSEKMFVGNIPVGTKIRENNLAVGIYWENKWGARDLDLSAVNLHNKVGWNSSYSQDDELYYSGDITNAPDGAVEYLYIKKELDSPTLVFNNIFNGEIGAQFKLIVGAGSDITKDYLLDPNKVILQGKTKTVSNQTILGIFNKETFTILNLGSTSNFVSGNNKITELQRKALIQETENNLSLNHLIILLGGRLTTDKTQKVDYDLSIDNLEKDTILNIFK